jgi:hypothetical protein
MEVLSDTHLMLGRVQKQRLRELAASRQASMAALVRDAIDHYLRVVAGPSPTTIRLAARDAAGVLPPRHELPPHSADEASPRWALE